MNNDTNSSGEIETWEPIGTATKTFDVRQSENSQPSQIAYAGEVENWKRIVEERRWILTCWTMGLFVVWVLVGLIVFAVKGNVWLLSSAGILALPLKTIFDYHFRKGKKRRKNKLVQILRQALNSFRRERARQEKKMAERAKERVQFDFSPEALQRLDDIKQKIGATTRAETVRNALRLYEWLVNEVEPDSTIKVFDKNNEIISVFKASLLLK